MNLIRPSEPEAQMTDARDERLDAALGLLDGQAKTRRPGYVPLLALCAFVGATTFFAHIVTTPKPSAASVAVATQGATAASAVPAHSADFELSGSSLSAAASEPVTDAVLIGKEQSR